MNKTLKSILAGAIVPLALLAGLKSTSVDIPLDKAGSTLRLVQTTGTCLEVKGLLLDGGSEANTAGWQGLFVLTDGNAALTVTNRAAGRGWMLWDITDADLPTNGTYDAQVLGVSTNRTEEWARGKYEVRGNPAQDKMPVNWITNSTVFLAVDEAISERLNSLLVNDIPPMIESATNGLATEAAVETAISNATNGLINAAQVAEQITAATNNIPTPDVSGQIAQATNALATVDALTEMQTMLESGLMLVGTADHADRADRAQEADNADSLARRDGYEILQQLDTNTATISNVQAEASLVSRLYSSTNVIAEVTNYNSIVHAPALRLLNLTETNGYISIWTETNGLSRIARAATNYTDVATNNLRDVYAPRAWSETTSGLGADAPAGVTWISTPQTVFAGGWEFEKVLETAGGGYWVLTQNGLTQSATTNAYMSLQANDGTEIISIEKTDSVLLGCDASAVKITSDAVRIPVPVVSTEHPLLRLSTNLTANAWHKQQKSDYGEDYMQNIDFVDMVTWSGGSGNWECIIYWQSSSVAPKSCFFYFEFLQEGGAKITHKALYNPEGGILCTDGVHKVRPVYNNGSVTWQVF